MENKDGSTVQIQVPDNVAYDTQKGDMFIPQTCVVHNPAVRLSGPIFNEYAGQCPQGIFTNKVSPHKQCLVTVVVRLPRGLRDGRVTSGRLDSPRDGRVTSGGLDSLRDGRVTSVGLDSLRDGRFMSGGLDSLRDGRFTSGGLDSLRDGRVTSVGLDSPRDGRFTSVGLDSPRDGRFTSVGLDSPRDGRFTSVGLDSPRDGRVTSVGLDSLRDGRVTLFKLRAYGQSRCHFPVVTSNLVYLSGVPDARSIGYHWPLNG